MADNKTIGALETTWFRTSHKKQEARKFIPLREIPLKYLIVETSMKILVNLDIEN